MLQRLRSSPQTRAILDELLREPAEWRYGYDLMQATGLAAGTLYPILMRMTDRGWLETTWEERTERGRPPRHLYRFTSAGARAAREMLAESTPTRAAVGKLADPRSA